MAGLLGLGGIGGMSGGIPAGLLTNPTLSQLFDPTAMRNYGIKRGLLDAGVALMNPDPHGPPDTFASAIGRAASGGVQGAQKAQDEYYNRGMQNVGVLELQRQYDQRDADKTAAIKLFNTLPPDLQASLGGSSYAEQYPAEFMKAYTDAQLKSKFDTSGTSPGDEWGINPIWTQDPQGNYHLYQGNKGGKDPREMRFAPGVNPVPNTSYVDTPTGVVPMPQKGTSTPGQYAPTIPKDVAGAESEKKRGEAIDNYRSMASKMPGLEQVITQLDDLATKGTYTAAGRVLDAGRRELGMDPRESAVARSQYIATIDNQILPLLRNTFGAQFTQVEGETLRATLGDPNKTPQEKQAVLKSFIEQKRRDVEAMALHAAAGTLNPADAATGGNLSGGPPPGVTAEEWGAMTPEERSHWQN